MTRIATTIAAAALALFAGACSIDVERNPDGSLQVTSAITEVSLTSELRAAIADPLVKDFEVDLRDGYVLVSAEKEQVFGDATDTVAFRLDLGVADGHLTAGISDAEINSVPIPQELVDVWNERIGTQLERAGRRNPDTSLVRVTISDNGVEMEWHVETAQSRSS